MYQTKQMTVTVADGNKLYSDAICPKLKWTMQGITFESDFRVLSIGGCDMVLGIDWIIQFSPILFDFHQLRLTFKKGSRKITL